MRHVGLSYGVPPPSLRVGRGTWVATRCPSPKIRPFVIAPRSLAKWLVRFLEDRRIFRHRCHRTKGSNPVFVDWQPLRKGGRDYRGTGCHLGEPHKLVTENILSCVKRQHNRQMLSSSWWGGVLLLIQAFLVHPRNSWFFFLLPFWPRGWESEGGSNNKKSRSWPLLYILVCENRYSRFFEPSALFSRIRET